MDKLVIIHQILNAGNRVENFNMHKGEPLISFNWSMVELNEGLYLHRK